MKLSRTSSDGKVKGITIGVQLVARLSLIPEIRSSNPTVGKKIRVNYQLFNWIERTKM